MTEAFAADTFPGQFALRTKKLTTRRSVISNNEQFQLIMNGLASPVVIR
ncbi:MAG: hypothetical protein ABI537_10135 [Casimicrobiaceae bacterium]